VSTRCCTARGAAWLLAEATAFWCALWLAYALPTIRLDTALSSVLLGLTGTGGVTGATLLGLTATVLLALRPRRSLRRILHEVLVHVVVLGTLLSGAALANEYALKPAVAIPRPNIAHLAKSGALGLTVEDFYTTMDKDERRHHLDRLLNDPDFEAVALTPGVRDHWIHEVGYSFPSGHTITATVLATYFVVLGVLSAATTRRRILHILPVWAVLVAWSRVLLGVHRPEDVVWGGLLGLVLGAAAAWLSLRVLSRLRDST